MKDLIGKILNEEISLIYYNDLLQHPIGKRKRVKDGFYIERLPSENNKVIFLRIEMEENVEMFETLHNCTTGIGLFTGSVLEIISSQQLNLIKAIKIKPFKRYAFRALETSVFYAYFYFEDGH